MQLPFDRRRLRERSELDERDELAAIREETPEERFLLALELAELTKELAEAAQADWPASDANDLSDKRQRYVVPLRAAMERQG